MKKVAFALLVGFLCLGSFQTLTAVEARSKSASGQRITGAIVGIGGRFGGRSRPFTLIVNGYTAPGQIQELTDALKRGGQDEMLHTLTKMSAGRIQVGANVGVVANVIISEPWGEGGTKLTVFYDRQVSFYELRYGTRSQDYPIGYAEIFLDRQGKGNGTLIAAARIGLKDGHVWDVEDFGIYPARLMGLRSTGQVSPR